MANELLDLAKAIARAEPDGTVLHQRISAIDRDVAGLLPGSAVGSAAMAYELTRLERRGMLNDGWCARMLATLEEG